MKEPLTARVVHPHAAAALLAILYVSLSVIYVVSSTHVAAVAAQSVEELEHFERVKGVLFVIGTGVLFYLVALGLLVLVKRQQDLLIAQHDTLVASEHRSLAGLFAASVAHDINNLLTLARGNAELIASSKAGPEAKQRAAESMESAFASLGTLSQRLMTLGKESVHGTLTEHDLIAVVERAVQLAKRHERLRKCTVTTKTGGSVVLPLDDVLIDRTLLNLLLNAADATKGTGRIEVRVGSDAERAWVEVHDDGPGVPHEALDAIFDAFYTSKPNGLGLGLVSVRLCADAHSGSVEVFRSDLGGAAFRLVLPRGITGR